MTEEDVKAIEPMMLASLARTIDFVKFGEAKNAALLTFASAWVLASANVAVGEIARDDRAVRTALVFGTPLLAVAAFLALLSFLPRTDLQKLKGKWRTNPPTNYLFFGHLSVLGSDHLHAKLVDRYLSAGHSTLNETYLDDLGCQIIVNAKIAATKFLLFTWGVRATICALVIYAATAATVVVG